MRPLRPFEQVCRCLAEIGRRDDLSGAVYDSVVTAVSPDQEPLPVQEHRRDFGFLDIAVAGIRVPEDRSHFRVGLWLGKRSIGEEQEGLALAYVGQAMAAGKARSVRALSLWRLAVRIVRSGPKIAGRFAGYG